jgi:arylamine N-acetyltransferase
MQAEREAQWEKLAQEVLSGMKDWRVQHPRATFAEIEEAVEEQIARMRAGMLEEVVQWREAQAAEQKQDRRCPSCGSELQERGKHVRQVTTQGNQQIKLERSYGYCPTCRVGFFPPR